MVERTFAYAVGDFIQVVVRHVIVNPIKASTVPQSRVVSFVGRYILNILISIDQFFNTLFLGDPDETISSRLGKLERNGETFYFTRLVIDFLDGLDRGHAQKSIEDDEGSNGLLDVIPENLPDLTAYELANAIEAKLSSATLKAGSYKWLYYTLWKTGRQLEIKDDADAILQTVIRRLRLRK